VLKRDDGAEIALNKDDFTACLSGRQVDVEGETLRFDYVFIAIHGDPGENGVLQEYFDKLNIPYSTSGTLTSKLTFDKNACKEYLRDTEVKFAASVIINKASVIDQNTILNTVGLPCFVKPNAGGSSCGISKVKVAEELETAIELGFSEDNEVLIEEFIAGREITCGVVQSDGKLISLGVTELITENEFFDYEAKYTPGKADEITPADISADLASECERQSIFMYNHLNCKGLARFDYIVRDNDLYCLEVNTVPGLSSASIIPKQAAYSGIALGELFAMIINETHSAN